MIPDIGGLVLIAGPGADGMAGTEDDDPIPGNSCGQSQADPCDWFATLEGGGNIGKKAFFMFAGLPAEVDNDPSTTTDNLLGVEFLPATTTVLTGTTPFTTSPDAVGSAVIFDQAGNPSTATYTAIAYLIGNVDNGGMFTHLYTSTSGSVTFTSGGDGVGDVIRGAVTPTSLTETDGVALISGGCTTSLELSYALTQGAAPAKRDGGATDKAHAVRNARAQAIYNNILRKTGRL